MRYFKYQILKVILVFKIQLVKNLEKEKIYPILLWKSFNCSQTSGDAKSPDVLLYHAIFSTLRLKTSFNSMT